MTGTEPGPELDAIGSALATAGRAIIADARHGLVSPEFAPAQAVHEIRKALKRWRALMRLLDGGLGEPADLMRREARDLMRDLAGARDAQACLDALDDLRKSEIKLSPTSMQTIHGRLTAIKNHAEERSFSDVMRDRLSRYLDYALLSLERWPLAEVEFAAIAEALAVTYRRVRQLVPEDWSEADAEHLHDLRRRVVEHRHQMDLIEHLWPRLGQLWAEEAQRLRNRLGACQDLAVLEQMAGPHQPLAPWRSRLAPMIVARRGAHIRAAARLAGRLFAEKPKAFRKRVTTLWEHRRPVAAVPTSAGNGKDKTATKGKKPKDKKRSKPVAKPATKASGTEPPRRAAPPDSKTAQ
ncbi:MAG: CHAD domain-containing protein [Xanthobacteraceae bacterium]